MSSRSSMGTTPSLATSAAVHQQSARSSRATNKTSVNLPLLDFLENEDGLLHKQTEWQQTEIGHPTSPNINSNRSSQEEKEAKLSKRRSYHPQDFLSKVLIYDSLVNI